MPTLFFRAPLIDPILSGRKTQTLRRSVAGTVMCADEVHIMCSHAEPPVCTVRITSIDRVHVDDLDHHDARREGLGSLPELVAAIESIYPGVPALMRVQFKLAE